uniref:rhomboid protease n=2 Tax=Phaeomonas parva TaxID=124430 RepID=A0A6U4K3R5_9STRA|mmetsp:Transcript_41587/g.130249  ORF Transcript_41587/g.130249 Transcript_41587/m.130249 type:complete len:301 (+) Transcript_41587:285-1187(+)
MIWEIGENGWKLEPLDENPFLGPSVDTLLDCGAINYYKIVDEGEWWRLAVGMWLHAGIIHFIMNGVVIIQIGRSLESLHGWYTVLPLYLLSGVFAACTTALLAPFTISVGASGALFGLLGGLWADLVQNWNMVYHPWMQLLGLGCVTLVNVFVGLAPLVDNYQHLGGMLMGISLGFTLFVQPRYDAAHRRRPKRHYQAVLQIIGAVIAFNILFLALVLMLLKVDVEGACGETCDAAACIDTGFWDCDMAKHSCTGQAFSNGTVVVDCLITDGSETFQVDYNPTTDLTNSRLEDLCEEACT